MVLLQRGLLHVVPLGLLWLALSGGEPASWVVGVPAVLAAAALSALLSSDTRWRVRPAGVLAFLPYFLWHSLRGGVDVALRALHPRLPIAPALEEFALRLPSAGPSRAFFVSALSLMPGTLGAELREDSIVVHLLVDAPAARAGIALLERRVAAVFGVDPHPEASPQG